MLVKITAEKPGAETKHLSADAPTYEEALAQAEAQIPEGYQMINIRVGR